MAREANMVEGEGKGRGKDEPQPQLQPQSEKVAPLEPTATPPPAPEQGSTTLPALPPSPPQKDARLRPLPPPHPAARGQDQQHPQQFPIGNYDPDHVHPNELPRPDMRRELANPPHKFWDLLKLMLSTLSLISSAIIIGLGLAIASWGGTASDEEVNFGITCATAGLAITFTAIDSFTMCRSRKRQGCHPGAHVAFQLIICLMAIFSIVVLSLFRSDTYYSQWTDWELYPRYKLHMILLIFSILLLAIHLFLFIRACVETHRFNRLKVRYVKLPGPPGGGMTGTGGSGVPYYPYPNGADEGGAVGHVWAYPQPYPQQPPAQIIYSQRQGIGPAPPQQAATYGEYYAPAAPPVDPRSAYSQPPPSTLLHGYYGPPKRSSNSHARRSQQLAPSGVAPGSGSRRASQQ